MHYVAAACIRKKTKVMSFTALAHKVLALHRGFILIAGVNAPVQRLICVVLIPKTLAFFCRHTVLPEQRVQPLFASDVIVTECQRNCQHLRSEE